MEKNPQHTMPTEDLIADFKKRFGRDLTAEESRFFGLAQQLIGNTSKRREITEEKSD